MLVNDTCCLSMIEPSSDYLPGKKILLEKNNAYKKLCVPSVSEF